MSESGPASTPIFTKPGRMPVPSIPWRASAVQRSASSRGLSAYACLGTALSFAAP